jgi:Gpi18-like mannosyltransferase
MRSRLGGVSATSALAILLLLGLVLRLAIAYVFYPGSGFGSDISTFISWALTLAEGGPGQFYATTSFADYPPGYLYVLWLVGGLAHLLAPLADGGAGAVAGALIKLPPMLADLGVGLALFWIVRRWAGERPDAARLGLAAAAIYVFNPVTWYDSALWGQTDAIGALVVLLTVAALVRGNSEGAAALTVLAALVKPQFGIVLVPLAAGVLLHRHVLAPGTGPAHRPMVPARLRGLREWFEQERGPWRLVSSATVALFLLLVMLVPFNLDIISFAERMFGTAGGYPWLSVNAYNPWALVASEGRAPLAHGGGWSPDEVALLGPLPGVVIGAGLLFASFVLVWLRTLWRSDRRTIVIAAVVLALAFFVLPTRVHERYMFPIFGLLPLLAVVDRRWLWATVALSAAAFINMHGILTNPLYATPNIANLALGEVFREPPAIYASVILHTAGFAFACWALLPRFAHRPDPWQAWTATPALAQPAATETVAPAGGVASRARSPPACPAGGPQRPATRPAAWVACWRWCRCAAIAAPNWSLSAAAGSTGGTCWQCCSCSWRRSGCGASISPSPHGMHFDEVYHARTGVEFLQHWRYGMPHSIYEYTHPHLAKYAMAVGIDTLGNNRVVSTSELGTSVRSAVIERRWDEDGAERRGDRAYLVTGSGVRVLDLATRREVTSLSTFAEVVAVDDSSHVLYLADSAGGLWQLPTDGLDELRADTDGPQQVTPEQIGRLSLPGPPLELFAANGRLIVLAEGDTLVSVDPVSGAELARTTVPGASSVVPVSADEADALAVGGARGFRAAQCG